MWQDPIVAETRALREQYANQFGHDADAIFQDILRRQSASWKRLLTFSARKPVLVQEAVAQYQWTYRRFAMGPEGVVGRYHGLRG